MKNLIPFSRAIICISSYNVFVFICFVLPSPLLYNFDFNKYQSSSISMLGSLAALNSSCSPINHLKEFKHNSLFSGNACQQKLEKSINLTESWIGIDSRPFLSIFKKIF